MIKPRLGWMSGSPTGAGEAGVCGFVACTGRASECAGGWEIAAYGLVLLAAAVRVAQTLAPSQATTPLLVSAAAAWSAAFAIYLWIYTPWLVRTRTDGRDG